MTTLNRGDVALPTLTILQALDLQSACMFAAIEYTKLAEKYPPDDHLRLYFEKRARECNASAELVRHALRNPKWEAQLDLIHDLSHNHWSE